MKLIHLSDLHLGKSLHETPLKDAQQDILDKILEKIDILQPDAVLLAGDLYDRRIPPEWAVDMLDNFLYDLSCRQNPDGQQLQVLLISGNHDSAERIAFGGRLMRSSGLHVSPVWQAGSVRPVTLQDAYGPVNFYLLPFVTRFQVKAAFPEQEISTYTQALQAAIADMHVNQEQRNVLLAHQFVTKTPSLAGSEESVGGLDNVDADVFDAFDYAALGHIHNPQHVQRETLRYSGSPLKYSFADTEQEKSLTVVDLEEKGTICVSQEPLKPAHDLARLRGQFSELLRPEDTLEYSRHQQDYLEIILTDEQPPAGYAARLRQIYPRLLHTRLDNTATRAVFQKELSQLDRQRPALELLEEFYAQRHTERDGKPAQLSEVQRSYAQKTLHKIAASRQTAADSTVEGGSNS